MTAQPPTVGHGAQSSVEGARLLFLCGLHRSGTTLLARLLQEHPAITGLSGTGAPMDEGQHIQSVYPSGSEFGGPGKFGFDVDSHMDETSDLATREAACRILRGWAPYWETGADYCLEKSPTNLVRTRFLQALFPNATFITIMRNPIVVAYATQKWSRTSISSLIEHWLLCHERFLEDKDRLYRSFQIRYEDLVADQPAVLSQIFSFLGLPEVSIAPMTKYGLNENYLKKWRRSCALPLMGWANRRTIRRFQTRVERFGYTLEPLQ